MLFINNLNWYSYISHSCLHRTFNTFKCLVFFKKAITQNKLMYSAVKKEPKERMPHVSFTKNNIYAAFNSLFISLSSGRAKHVCNMTTWSWKQLLETVRQLLIVLQKSEVFFEIIQCSLKLYPANFFILSIFLVDKHSIKFLINMVY